MDWLDQHIINWDIIIITELHGTWTGLTNIIIINWDIIIMSALLVIGRAFCS